MKPTAMSTNNRLPLAMTMGDAAGIGPEIIVKLHDKGLAAPCVVYGDTGALRRACALLNAPPILPVRDAKTLTEYADSTLLVLRWGYTNPEAARIAMEMFERPIAGAVINMVDYPAHARRRYGDAIHHITNLTEYYDQDDVGGGLTWVDRMRRKWRRSRRNLAENLHFN